MDAAQEARCKEMLDQILIMVMKMASDLLGGVLRGLRATHPAVVADSDNSEHEHGANDCGALG
jgi:hypothetical protein